MNADQQEDQPESAPSRVEVTLDRDHGRFEATINGEVAGFIAFRAHGSVLDLRHTVVDPDFEGRGVGSALVVYALDTIREGGLKLIPTCPFVKAYVDRHPGYADLIAEH